MTFDPNDPRMWRIKIVRPVFAFRIDFYLYRVLGNKVEVIGDGGSKNFLINMYDNLEKATPLVSFTGADAKDILRALAEALEDEGVKTPNDFKVSGLLEATKYHLEDLRHLLKLQEKRK